MQSFKILSWNILGPQALDILSFQSRYRQVIDWQYRFHLLLQKIISFDPDIICLQEIDIKIKQEFVNALYEYGFCQSSYAQRAEIGGVMVLHKISKFELVDKNNALLSTQETLDYPGVCAWAILVCKQTKKELFIASIHLYWELGKEQLAELKQIFGASISMPMILAGDFNITYPTMVNEIVPYMQHLNIIEQQELLLLQHSSWTTQPPHNADSTCWQSLDHILFSNALKLNTTDNFVGDPECVYKDGRVKTMGLVKDSNKESIPNDTFPSDHLPIIASFTLHRVE